MYLGTFLACLGALFLEIVATRVLGVVQGPETILYTVATAMLGMGAAGSLFSVIRWRPDSVQARKAAGIFCILAAVSIVVLFAVATAWKLIDNERAAASFTGGGFDHLLRAIVNERTVGALVLGVVLSIPYFFTGALLAVLFQSCRQDEVHRLYAVDLIGACIGCLLAIVALEVAGFVLPLALAVAIPLLAAAAYLRPAGAKVVLPLLVAALLWGVAAMQAPVREHFEPQPFLPRLGKLYDPAGEAEELWHTWNSYSRVAAMKVRRGPDVPREDVMALGLGEGHAVIRPYLGPDAPPGPRYLPAELALALGTPKNVLVLLAGAGRDMVAIDELTRGRARIVGVEINHAVISWPMQQSEFRLAEFFAQPHARLVNAEAREFLESDDTLYDSILLSWSGANMSYYTGAAGHQARYVYTKEGLAAALDRLSEGGWVTILNTNKIRVIAAIRSLLEERGVADVSRCFVLLDDPASERSDWRKYWDENRLVVKPAGFEPADLARLRELAARWNLRVRYEPGQAADPDNPYRAVVLADDLEATLRTLGEDDLLDFSISTDDRPFILDLFPSSAYFGWRFWSGDFEVEKGGPGDTVWRFKREHAKILLLFMVVSLVLVLGPLVVRREGFAWSRESFNDLAYFGGLGAGFMLIEIGFIQKLSLFLGHPGQALAVVLASLILFTGIGSFASGPLFRRGILSFRSAALCAAAVAVLLLAVTEFGQSLILPLPHVTRMVVVFLLLGLPGFLLGQLFPQGLASLQSRNPRFVPWAFAVNAATGTLAAGIGVVLAQTLGFRQVILLGAAFYVFVAMLPHQRRARGAAPPAP